MTVSKAALTVVVEASHDDMCRYVCLLMDGNSKMKMTSYDDDNWKVVVGGCRGSGQMIRRLDVWTFGRLDAFVLVLLPVSRSPGEA